MCGIAGFVDFERRSDLRVAQEMARTLNHRGPDAQGVEFLEVTGTQVGLAHTRLAILDLSEAGRQPMHFGKYTIILNGEIYNFQEITRRLVDKGHSFVSKSDTEVVLHAFAEWGEACVEQFIGMFAFVIIDRETGQLHACRDRAGVKPLYFYWDGSVFLFASELKALHAHPAFRKEIDIESAYYFFQYSYIPGPGTIFQKTRKMEPGTWLHLDLKTRASRETVYWKLGSFFEQPLLDISYEEAKAEVSKLLVSACNYRMVADVPVGIFLSGGYDSSLVTALIQADSSSRLKTYTIGFPDGIDETPHAEAVARHLGTDHHAHACTYRDAQDIIPDLPYYYDEPFADISAIPSILVSRLARKEVTVALSADGGDELFAGYSQYKNITDRLAQVKRYERGGGLTRALVGAAGSLIPPSKFHLKHQVRSLSSTLALEGQHRVLDLMYHGRTMAPWFSRQLFNQEYNYRPAAFSYTDGTFSQPEGAMLHLDYIMNLRDCLLVKVDRASMSTSLEGREPLMDHRLAELAARLPMHFKYDGRTFKKMLRDITHNYIPASVMDRPKVGFDLPIYSWLKKDLAGLIDEHLAPQQVAQTGILNPRFVSSLVSKFRNDTLLYKPIIWRLLMFQMWYKRWM